MRVHIEAEQLAAELQILFQQHRNAFAVGFHVGDHSRQGIKVAKKVPDGGVAEVFRSSLGLAERPAGFDETSEVEIRFLIFQKARD